MAKKEEKKKVNISAITGRYVKAGEVKKHPNTTVTMSVSKGSKLPKKKS